MSCPSVASCCSAALPSRRSRLWVALWQRAVLAVVTVSGSQAHADRELAAAADEIERVEPGLITRTEVEFLT